MPKEFPFLGGKEIEYTPQKRQALAGDCSWLAERHIIRAQVKGRSAKSPGDQRLQTSRSLTPGSRGAGQSTRGLRPPAPPGARPAPTSAPNRKRARSSGGRQSRGSPAMALVVGVSGGGGGGVRLTLSRWVQQFLGLRSRRQSRGRGSPSKSRTPGEEDDTLPLIKRPTSAYSCTPSLLATVIHVILQPASRGSVLVSYNLQPAIILLSQVFMYDM
ncbi:hypothetical protein BRADI_4g23682v3 [Brachypodium distachyon]|uniref:Uncharacterized protein n=1 Tax=Brachypodium distachyon TaxID=15368 RepID=A0A2K2CPT7_BRADI|nr:hypothetical protein BRADI_4g23682v3 [Brachypodium distachyon]